MNPLDTGRDHPGAKAWVNLKPGLVWTIYGYICWGTCIAFSRDSSIPYLASQRMRKRNK